MPKLIEEEIAKHSRGYEFLEPGYKPPESLKFNEEKGYVMTPNDFDDYRNEQDPYADCLAESIVAAGLFFAKRDEAKRRADYEKDNDRAYLGRISQELVEQIDHVVNYTYAKWRKDPNLSRDSSTFDWNSYPGNDPENPIEPYELTAFQETVGATPDYGEANTLVEMLNIYFSPHNDKFHFSEEEHKTINNGCYIFNLYGPNMVMILAVRSLLKQYAAFNASNVLVSTRMLTKFPHRRILETMQFLLDVVTPGNMKPEGKGVVAIRKLRLVHALVRARIAMASENVNPKYLPWQEKSWGKAINQQDMVFAIHTFSIEIINGLQKVGYFLELDNIREDYYFMWHLIGRALGLKDEINCCDYKNGLEIQNYIYQTQFRIKNSETTPNLTSVVLAEPLIRFIIDFIPFTNKREDAIAIIRYYNDEEDYEPVFTKILGIETDPRIITQGKLSDKNEKISFEYFLSGLFTLFDSIIIRMYNISSFFKKKSKKDDIDFYKRVGSRNLAIFYKLERMSKTWKGSSFSLGDGSGSKQGKLDKSKGGGIRFLKAKVLFLIGFAFLPLFFIGLGVISVAFIYWIERLGRKHPRPDLNKDAERDAYLKKNKKFLERIQRKSSELDSAFSVN